jgi:hypothetical protein
MDCEVDKLDGQRAVALRGLPQGGNLILVTGNDKLVRRLYPAKELNGMLQSGMDAGLLGHMIEQAIAPLRLQMYLQLHNKTPPTINRR